MQGYVYKEGLYEKFNIETDIPSARFKNYEYTKKDFIDTSYKDKIPLLFVDYNTKKIKLENGVLFINDLKYNITNYKIKDVIDIFNRENIQVQVLENSDVFTILPSIFLSDFNNTSVTKIDGDISPLSYSKKLVPNKTIYSVEDIITSIDVINLSTNLKEPFSISGDNIFYTVGRNTKCYIKTVAHSFYIFGDMSVKQVLDGSFIANLSNKIIEEE